MSIVNGKHVCAKFVQTLRKQQLLKDSWEVTLEEQMAIFIMPIGHSERKCYKNDFSILVKQLMTL